MPVSSPQAPLTTERSAMDIRFCSVCNQSIPDGEFDAGRAIVARGRNQHVSCALERAAEAGGWRSWVGVVLGLFAAGISLFLLVAHLGAAKDPVDPHAVPTAVQAHVGDAVRQSDARLVALLDGREAAQSAKWRKTLADEVVDPLNERLGETMGEWREKNDAALRGVSERFETISTRLEGLREQVSMLSSWQESIRKQADQLEDALRKVEERGATVATPSKEAAPPPAAAESTAPDPARENELKALLAALASEDAELVFTATVDLGRFGDLRAVEPLLGVLAKHGDAFARAGSAGALGQLKAADAMVPLIEALGDKDELVQSAAASSIEAISGQSFGYASRLPARDRKRIQGEMRKWWKDNELGVRERLGQAAPL